MLLLGCLTWFYNWSMILVIPVSSTEQLTPGACTMKSVQTSKKSEVSWLSWGMGLIHGYGYIKFQGLTQEFLSNTSSFL
jgi:hypothetical protein